MPQATADSAPPVNRGSRRKKSAASKKATKKAAAKSPVKRKRAAKQSSAKKSAAKKQHATRNVAKSAKTSRSATAKNRAARRDAVVDPLILAFRLALARRMPADQLLHLDPQRIREAAGSVAARASGRDVFRSALVELEKRQPNVQPNALWLAWMRTTREHQLARLSQEFNQWPQELNQ